MSKLANALRKKILAEWENEEKQVSDVAKWGRDSFPPDYFDELPTTSGFVWSPDDPFLCKGKVVVFCPSVRETLAEMLNTREKTTQVNFGGWDIYVSAWIAKTGELPGGAYSPEYANELRRYAVLRVEIYSAGANALQEEADWVVLW